MNVVCTLEPTETTVDLSSGTFPPIDAIDVWVRDLPARGVARIKV